MNIISNNCAGAAIYKYVLNSPYKNPFIWCTTNLEELIPHFYEINFARIKLYNESPNLDKVWHIHIDEKIDCRFLHAKFDASKTTPYIHDVDVYYNKIWEYLFDNYRKRVHRMLSDHDIPIYILYIHAKHQLKLIDIAQQHRVKYITIAPERLYADSTVLVQEDEQLTINSVVRVCNRYKDTIREALAQAMHQYT